MLAQPLSRLQLAGLLLGRPFYLMLGLLTIEAALAATVTWFVIKASRDVTNDEFLISDLIWILGIQSASYAVGAISWIFAERAGFKAFGLYMHRFASENKDRTKLLAERSARELTEPFLTGESFHVYFELVYEIEHQLKLFLFLIFNLVVFATEIDPLLPVAYIGVFASLLLLQWTFRKRVASAYLENQRRTNRMTAHGYTAWDNVFSGNRYNLRLWARGFRQRLREALHAQIVAILTREGLSAASGSIGLAIVFATMVYVAQQAAGDTAILIALAATLPRQIEMTHDVHQLASGWNEMLQIWTRLGGVCQNLRPSDDPDYDARIKYDRLMLKEGEKVHHCAGTAEALEILMREPHGRVLVRGGNGSGKSTLLAALKSEIKLRAYYFPTTDRLAFRFSQTVPAPTTSDDDDEEETTARSTRKGFSSGERQLRSLEEIVMHTDAQVYLLDEWDANLDPTNRALAESLVDTLAQRARVIEISHRDR
ncbi:MAG: hypothetical protein QOD74_2612 [Variibacter sp.]|jgi:ABC-type transport system involved in cytochrome bd biosynthesis fused ATPase/permease subunit|nr:hypothetical protein [Variibacter sp.]